MQISVVFTGLATVAVAGAIAVGSAFSGGQENARKRCVDKWAQRQGCRVDLMQHRTFFASCGPYAIHRSDDSVYRVVMTGPDGSQEVWFLFGANGFECVLGEVISISLD